MADKLRHKFRIFPTIVATQSFRNANPGADNVFKNLSLHHRLFNFVMAVVQQLFPRLCPGNPVLSSPLPLL
jgi:hypothetical protein